MKKNNFLKPRVIIAICLIFSFSVHSKEYSFDTKLLGLKPDDIDINYILKDLVKPGLYTADVYLNDYFIGTKDINFISDKYGSKQSRVVPCLVLSDMQDWGMDINKIKNKKKQNKQCVFITEDEIKMKFNVNNRKLNLIVPQFFLVKNKKEIAPIEVWDDGISAAIINYSFGERKTNYNSYNYSYNWARLMPGFNIGPWRFRNNSYVDKSTFTATKWHNQSSYLERGFYKIKSRVVIGKKTTPGLIFNSLPFTGVMFGTDENMLASSDRQYSPVVRGVARSSARVEVKQNGYTVYNTNVPAGPFEFNDIPQIQNGGSLDIIVWESDGTTQRFTVPYQIPAIALHQGYLNYNIMAGRYSSAYAGYQNPVSQITLMYGLPADFSGYGGVQLAKNYQSTALGLGKSLGVLGGLSLDTTHSRASYYTKKSKGQMWRLRYNNTLDKTNTSLGITHSLFGSSYIEAQGFFEAASYNYLSSTDRVATSFQLSQSLAQFGLLSLTYQIQENKNWDNSDNYRLSWSANFKYFYIGADWQNSKVFYTREKKFRKESVFSFFLTMPLEPWFGNNLQATWNLVNRSKRVHEQQYGLKGQSFDRQLVWDISESYTKIKNTSLSSAANLEWSGTYGKIRANYSRSRNSRDLGFSIDGGLILHENGLTIGHPFTNSVALTEALGAAAVSVSGWPGIRTDLRGYTLIPNLNNYQRNNIKLDTKTLSNQVEILNTEKQVIPTSGAIVNVKFNTIIGVKAIIKIKDKNGSYLPLGAQVYVKEKKYIAGLIDEEGSVYLSGLDIDSQIVVNYRNKKCTISNLPIDINSHDYLQQFSAVCE